MELETDASSSGTTRTRGPFASGFFAADPFAVDAFAAEASDAFAVDVFFMGPRVPYQLQVVLCGAFPEPFVAAGSASSYSPLYALPSPRHRVWLVPEALCESSFC